MATPLTFVRAVCVDPPIVKLTGSPETGSAGAVSVALNGTDEP